MLKQDKLFKITDLPKKLIDEISRLIFSYSTGLIEVTTNTSGKESANLIGSGTFVSFSNTFGILTAAHVVNLLKRPFSLGLIISEHVHKYKIDSNYLEIIHLAKGEGESDGPDLAFIVIPSSELGTIRAKKSFHNLDIKRDLILNNPPEFDRGIWAVCGVPNEKTIDHPPGIKFDPLKGFLMLIGFGSIRRTYTAGEYDYCDFEVNYDSSPDIPQSFGGVSGGGLWQIPLRKSSEQTIEPIEYILSGVAFYQTERTGLNRSIKCHARNSIYDKAYSFITENRKQKTENRPS
ncbi:MAG: hypothetical protein AB1424_14880 [Thermodesulfobacteriota bacterium]